jgi:hypothetical protein
MPVAIRVPPRALLAFVLRDEIERVDHEQDQRLTIAFRLEAAGWRSEVVFGRSARSGSDEMMQVGEKD